VEFHQQGPHIGLGLHRCRQVVASIQRATGDRSRLKLRIELAGFRLQRNSTFVTALVETGRGKRVEVLCDSAERLSVALPVSQDPIAGDFDQIIPNRCRFPDLWLD
jgi:hypothetical protein